METEIDWRPLAAYLIEKTGIDRTTARRISLEAHGIKEGNLDIANNHVTMYQAQVTRNVLRQGIIVQSAEKQESWHVVGEKVIDSFDNKAKTAAATAVLAPKMGASGTGTTLQEMDESVLSDEARTRIKARTCVGRHLNDDSELINSLVTKRTARVPLPSAPQGTSTESSSRVILHNER